MLKREQTMTPAMAITIGGVDVYSLTGGQTGDKRTIVVKELLIEQKLDAPDSFRIRYGAQDMGTRVTHTALRQGKEIEIKMGWGQPEPLFKGEVTYVTVSFGGGQETIFEVSGFDRSHRLTRGTRSRTWGDGLESNIKYADVFSEVVSQAKADEGGGSDSLTAGEAGSEGSPVAYVPQLNLNDYMFLRALGADVDQKLDSKSTTDDRNLLFRKPDTAGTAVATVCYDKVTGPNAVRGERVRFTASAVRQVAKVQVRSWDPDQKKNIIGEATSPTLQFGHTPGHEVAGQAFWGGGSAGKTLVITDHPVESKEEAEAVAQSIFDQLSMDFVTGTAEVLGNPHVEPGCLLEFRGYGEAFDGPYLVIESSHVFVAGVRNYVTRVRVARTGANELV